MDEAADQVIWRYASANQMAVISKDEDFAYLAFPSKCNGTIGLGADWELPEC